MTDPNAPQGPHFQGSPQPGPPPQDWQPQGGQPQGWQPQPGPYHQGSPPQGWQQGPPTPQQLRAQALADKAHRKAMRPWFKKKRFIIPIALVALALLGRLFAGNPGAPIAADPAASTGPAATTAPVPAPSAQQTTEEAKKPAEPANAKIGQSASAGDWDFKVTKFRCGVTSVGNEYLNKKPQGQFCFLNLEATNNGNDEGTLSDGNLKLLDADGKEYSSDYEASVYEDSDSTLFLKGVNPGNTAKGLVVFDVPKKVKPTQASLAGGLFGTKSVVIDLK